GVRSGNLTPLGLITTKPAPGSRALTLPLGHATKLFKGNSACRAQTSARSSGNNIMRDSSLVHFHFSTTIKACLLAQGGFAPDVFQALHDIVGPPAEIVIQDFVFRVELVIGGGVFRDRRDHFIL